MDQALKNKIRTHAFNTLPYWIAGLSTGLIATQYAILFKKLALHSFELFQSHFLIWALLVPIGFFVSWILVNRFSPEASGSGIPQVMASIEKGHPEHHFWYQKILGIKVLVIKILSSLASVAVGGAIGREGPTIQIGASIFNFIFKFIPIEKQDENKKRKALILAGGAAGIAAAFNTPLGGIVFAIEELATDSFKEFRSTVLLAVIVSGMTAQWITGSYLYLGHPLIQAITFPVLIGALATALLGGAFGGFFGASLFKIVSWRRKIAHFRSQIFWILFLSLIFVGLAFCSNGIALGPGTERITELLNQNPQTPLTDVIVRFVANQVSYLVGGAGGIFSPALSIGANLGSYLSQLFFSTGEATNLLIIVGMVSFLTGVTHAPFTSLVLVLEMMDQPALSVPVMFAAIIAHGIAKLITPLSFYEMMSQNYIPPVKDQE